MNILGRNVARVTMAMILAAILPFSAATAPGFASAAQVLQPVHYGQDEVTVFPDGGREFSVRLPAGIPPTANLIAFAATGRSAYLQEPSAGVLGHADELIEVDFSPLRRFSVPGSGGLGEIISVTNSSSGILLVSAVYGHGGCGAYAIDATRGTRRSIWTTAGQPPCRFFVTQVAPDGNRVLVANFDEFKVINTQNGAIEFSAGGRGSWSPDGKQLAIFKNGEITILDGRTFAKRGHFRASSVDGHLVWRPDSKCILFVQRERRCPDDFESLAVLDIEAGKKWVVSSSHCMVTNSQIGWIDSRALKASGED
jgi:hypothetical protein